jgi:carbamoyltransferase
MGYILGLGGPYHHDSSACLVDTAGTIIAFAEEERFSRRKHHKDSRSCSQAAAYCLAAAGITLYDLDEIAVAFNPIWPTAAGHIVDSGLIQEILNPGEFGGATAKQLTIIPHHLSHAASAFYPSGFADAAVLVVDGSGDGISTSLFHGTAAGLRVIREFPFTQSLGWFYETVAEHLALGNWTSSGKLMGLAAYGRPVYDLNFLTADDSDCYLLDLSRYGLTTTRNATADYNNFNYYRDLKRAYGAAYTDLGIPPHCRVTDYDLGTGRLRADSSFSQAHADLAASAQHVLEQHLLRLAQTALRETGSSRLCVAGGVGLNCSANGVLQRQSGATHVFVQPAAGDAGCAIGAALECARRAGSLRIPGTQQTLSAWGPTFTDEHILDTLNDLQISCKFHGDDISAVAARHIAHGRIIGWFQGPAEAGPRALGNRSILGDPRRVTTRDRINRDIKRREMWRPLAPSIHIDAAGTYICKPGPTEFMIVGYQATDEALARIPATVHVDGSLRPQTVRADIQPRYAALLTQLNDETGVPAVLNTSFNHEAEPIVCTPVDAIRTFYSTPLDALAIGGFIVTKNQQNL